MWSSSLLFKQSNEILSLITGFVYFTIRKYLAEMQIRVWLILTFMYFTQGRSGYKWDGSHLEMLASLKNPISIFLRLNRWVIGSDVLAY